MKNIPAIKVSATEAKRLKQSSVDELLTELHDAAIELERLQSLVDTLSERRERLAKRSGIANDHHVQANKVAEATAQSVQLVDRAANRTDEAASQAAVAAECATALLQGFSQWMNELLLMYDLVNRLYLVTIRKKALNPLIPDALIQQLMQAGADVNEAISLSITALKSVQAARTSLHAVNTHMTMCKIPFKEYAERLQSSAAAANDHPLNKASAKLLAQYDHIDRFAAAGSEITAHKLGYFMNSKDAALLNLQSLRAAKTAAEAALSR